MRGLTPCTLRAFHSQMQARQPFVLRLSHSAGQAHPVIRSRRDRSVSGCFILIAAGLLHQRRPHATAGGRSSSDSRMQVRLRACRCRLCHHIHDVAIVLLYFYFFTRDRQAFVKEQEFLRERGREAR